jgi:CrcB protein
MTELAFIAAGGAVGAVSRYAVVTAGASIAGGFPYGTLAVNVAGSLLMGLLVEGIALGVSLPESVRLALAVGLLGAFTTFSAFSFDTYALYEQGRLAAAALYVVATTVLSVGALLAGVALARSMARITA